VQSGEFVCKTRLVFLQEQIEQVN